MGMFLALEELAGRRGWRGGVGGVGSRLVLKRLELFSVPIKMFLLFRRPSLERPPSPCLKTSLQVLCFHRDKPPGIRTAKILPGNENYVEAFPSVTVLLRRPASGLWDSSADKSQDKRTPYKTSLHVIGL
jgi:hypothetical protein